MSSPAASATSVALLRIDGRGVSIRRDDVATEEPLEIQLGHVRRGLRVIRRVSVTMCTPGHDAELAAGFLFAEGVIADAGQIAGVAAVAPPAGTPAGGRITRVILRDDVVVDPRPLARHFTTTSSCGVCGKASLEGLRVPAGPALPPDGPVFDAAVIRRLPDVLRAAQAGFDRTGGLHAAALFTTDGRLLAVREDVGRHNAVDKLVGAQVLAGRSSLGDCGLFVSGRASFELMQKAVRAGVPVLAAVGAPSSLAVDVAREAGATLLGFVRDGRFNIYSGAARVREALAATSAPPAAA